MMVMEGTGQNRKTNMNTNKQNMAVCMMSAVCMMAAVSLTVQAARSPLTVQRASVVECRQASASAVTVLPVQTNLLRLRKADTLWVVLKDPQVKKAMNEAMGTAVKKYLDATEITELPDVKNNELYSAGAVKGLYTIMESFFDLNLLTGKVCIAVLDDSTLSVYGVESFDKLPVATREYIEDLKTRMVDSSGLSIHFKKPEGTQDRSAG
jgi:hypothetical protein